MPTLHGRARTLYDAMWGEDEYERWISASVQHTFVVKPDPQPPYSHKPYHDIESFFWVFFWTLLCTAPKDAPDKERTSPSFVQSYDMIATHGVGLDTRNTFEKHFSWEEGCLHSGILYRFDLSGACLKIYKFPTTDSDESIRKVG